MSPADMDCLDAMLGPGNSGVFSRGYGKCRIMATSLANVWRVQYFNGMNSILLDTLEITRIPEVALASEDDLADSLDRLQEAWQWLQGEY
jgi:hydrogenase-1 operon protein HyaF